jgi:hypothetical protein
VVYEHVGSVYHNARTANGTSPHPQLIYHEESGEYVNPCFLTPAQIAHHHNTLEHPLTPHPIPISPSPFTSTPPLPQPTPPTFVTSPPLNEQGHMSTFTDVNDDAGEHLTDYPPPTYTDLDALRRDYDNGVPDAITYMQGLQAYSDECLREIMEEERQEEVRYTLEHPPSPPPNPTAISDNKPDYIEVSRPLFAQPKRQHRKKYPERRPLPTPTHHLNNNSTPYPTSRLRPPPWPNKNPDRKRRYNKRHHSKHPPVNTTTKQRPPPWPILPTPTPILSIKNSHPPPLPNIHHRRRRQYPSISCTLPMHPPPWPIIPHNIHPTLQNR